MLKRSLAALLAALLLSALCLSGCSSASSEGSASSASPTSSSSAASEEGSVDADMMTVAVEIDPSAVEDALDGEGAALSRGPEDIEVPVGSSAYDALVALGAEVEGSPSYVTSINGLAEKQVEGGGWMYEVNGEIPSVAADGFVLSPGDSVRWYYGTWE